MKRRDFIKKSGKAGVGLLAGTSLGHMLLGCSGNGQKKKLNFVFLLADDLGWNQVGYHGTSFYETPHIDRLAKDGMSFTDAYAACPVCSPTRASIMTGKYPARLHLTDFIAGNPYPFAKLKQPEWIKYLPLEEITIAEVFKKEGYVTGCFGKWHLSTDKNYKPGRPFDPDSQGFDEILTTVKPKSSADPDQDAHHVKAITEHSLAFLDKNKNKPFFLYIPHHVVHTPLLENKELIAKYQAKKDSDLPENNPTMGAMIETLDKGIGQVLQKIDDLNLTDNTVVIFFSDNGGLESKQDQKPLRGGKAMVYEGGIRVPLVVRWPGVVKEGSVCREPVTSTDFFPTMMEIAGLKCDIPNIDGKSILPLLKQSKGFSRGALYWHYPHYHTSGKAPSGAVRKGDYKLIEWYEDSILGGDNPYSLFHIAEDISEEDDLAKKMPEKTTELATDLRKWRSRVGAQEMRLNPDYNAEKEHKSK